ncbi:hypothetical protein ACFO1S_24015 [Cohnella boryungensis]|uniref:Uncharacterized protein n=1 Tax=Cohnella boryungensis TaxID=768479 RepID=A0ABV8SFZ5_9BACL
MAAQNKSAEYLTDDVKRLVSLFRLNAVHGQHNPFVRQTVRRKPAVTVRNLASIWALEHYSPITLLFPIVTIVCCLVLIAVVTHRRLSLRRRAEEDGPG